MSAAPYGVIQKLDVVRLKRDRAITGVGVSGSLVAGISGTVILIGDDWATVEVVSPEDGSAIVVFDAELDLLEPA